MLMSMLGMGMGVNRQHSEVWKREVEMALGERNAVCDKTIS